MNELDLTTKQMVYYTSKKKNVVIAYLIGFILGGFGAHAFYVGGDVGNILGLLSIVGILVSLAYPAFYIIYGIFLFSGVVYTYFLVEFRNRQLMQQAVLLIDSND